MHNDVKKVNSKRFWWITRFTTPLALAHNTLLIRTRCSLPALYRDRVTARAHAGRTAHSQTHSHRLTTAVSYAVAVLPTHIACWLSWLSACLGFCRLGAQIAFPFSLMVCSVRKIRIHVCIILAKEVIEVSEPENASSTLLRKRAMMRNWSVCRF